MLDAGYLMLDAGCGAGPSIADWMSRGHRVKGIGNRAESSLSIADFGFWIADWMDRFWIMDLEFRIWDLMGRAQRFNHLSLFNIKYRFTASPIWEEIDDT